MFRFCIVDQSFRSGSPSCPSQGEGMIEVGKEMETQGQYYSPRIAKMIEERKNKPGMDQMEFEVEASIPTWSEVPSSALAGEALAEDNMRVFKRLQRKYEFSGFFKDWKEEHWVVGRKIAEGGQAELFEAWHRRDVSLTKDGFLKSIRPTHSKVMKMFKEGLRLQDLQSLLPLGILSDEEACWRRHFHCGIYCNDIDGAMLFNGRFALVMGRKWGDLRKVIDARMIHNNMRGPPFTSKERRQCMFQVAKGMKELHDKNIVHRDLKAANVLVCSPGLLGSTSHLLNPIDDEFCCKVADYECSVGVVGTGFWRAPEILIALKNRNVTPDLFTQASDVYSYGMTCYEILTGCIPYEVEDCKSIEYDRPRLPSETPHWMKELLLECWHGEPSKRPTFKRILWILRRHRN